MIIIVLDAIALISAAVALVLLAFGWRRIRGADIRVLLAVLLSMNLLYVSFLFIEWVGISHLLERYEDFIGALIPMTWAFVFYAYLQRKATLDLRRSEENIRVTLDSIADGVIATTAQGAVSRMNPVAEKLTGWSFGEAQGRPLGEVFTIINTRTREPETNPADTALATGDTVRLANHTTLISRDGCEYQIADAAAPMRNAAGEIMGIVLIFRDVTEEYQLRRRVAESEQRMDLALRGGDLGTWDWNVKTGEVVVNERWAAMLGYRLDEIEGHVSMWEQKVHPDDLPDVMRTLDAHLEGETELYETEHRLRHKNGDWIWVLDKGRVIERDDDGGPIRACGTHLEITERKLHAERMLQIQKIEAIGRLAGGVAHDLNNLLSPILGYSEILQEDEALGEESQRHISEIMRAGLGARELVRQLLAFCRKQLMELRPVHINDTIEGFAGLLQRTIPEDVTIKVVTHPDVRPVLADVGQIEQIIMNLAVNAADAMPDGGVLTIETAVCELDSSYVATRPDVKPGQYVMLAISDTGCGMDEEIRERIFEPFFSTKGERGTGLGLATVFGIVKQHGGSIWLYSEPGEGTTFKIYLPVTDDELGEEEAAEKPVADISATETILLVEDNEQVRHMTNAILERQGYTVLSAGNGEDALRALAAHGGPIHLLLTDVVMPGMSGKILFERASQQQPRLKVLYMSGYTNNVIAHRGVIDRDVQYIQKPYSINGLTTKIRDVLGG